jgi:hypothetical protein
MVFRTKSPMEKAKEEWGYVCGNQVAAVVDYQYKYR